MAAQNFSASIRGVAEYYADFLDGLIVHDSDADAARPLANHNLEIKSTDILMRTDDDRARIARTVLELARPELRTVKVAEAS
jgi:2-phospho-L-lactate transferase/gluconeogenesis factor (CofD/UPF0052 family)